MREEIASICIEWTSSNIRKGASATRQGVDNNFRGKSTFHGGDSTNEVFCSSKHR